MLKYNSSLPPLPAYANPHKAMAAMRAPSPYGQYGSSHADIMRSMGDENAAKFSIAATRANTDQELARQQAQRELVLRGLQQMNEAQQNRLALGNATLQGMSSLLSGLFE